jgi:predicted DNA-binding protein (MmcQ/YjbR family)
MPFDDTTIVFKVGTKMFCLESINNKRINIKAKPEKVIELIEDYSSALPAYHMNKKHWLSIELDNFLNDKLLKQLILESYNLVISKMTKKEKEQIQSSQKRN